jgi:hypothetical protein
LTPGSGDVTSYTERGYTFSIAPVGKIFVGTNSPPAITTAPYIFASTGGVQFQLDSPRPFDLRSIALGPINGSVGAQTVTFTGTRAEGGTVTQSFTTGAAEGFQTFVFDPSFRRLTSVRWDPVIASMDSVSVEHGPTMTFKGLVPGNSYLSYSENGFRLDPIVAGTLLAGNTTGAAGEWPYTFASHVVTRFRYTADGDKPFDLYGIDIGSLNGSVGPQSVTFTGTLAGGGTVTETFATDGTANLTPFYFGSEFSNLVAVEWNAGGMNFDNIEAGLFVPEPSSAAVAGTIVTLAAIRRRRRATTG